MKWIGVRQMKVNFLSEAVASDFFNEITNNYTEDILDPYHGRIDWYLTNFYEKPVNEFEVDEYDTKYYNKDLYNWRNESVINIAEMFYAFNEFAELYFRASRCTLRSQCSVQPVHKSWHG